MIWKTLTAREDRIGFLCVSIAITLFASYFQAQGLSSQQLKLIVELLVVEFQVSVSVTSPLQLLSSYYFVGGS